MATTSSHTYTIENVTALSEAVHRIVHSTPVTDVHTHLYPPAFGDLLLWGIDELLTYHYLIAETLRVSDVTYESFWGRSKSEQAELIWDELFLRRSPISEACRGVLTALNKLGIDTAARDLEGIRAWFGNQTAREYIDTVFHTANIQSAVMTNDPFDAAERAVWEGDHDGDPRFHAALRIDPLLNDWPSARDSLLAMGYDAGFALKGETLTAIRRFLSDWLERMNALYMAVSLPPDFAFPEASDRAAIIEHCVLPVAREHNVPFALMIGVTRQVNPALKLAGDGVGRADLDGLAHLCAHYPQNKFMTTVLSLENQHELCVLGRKFRNLMIFGCWWFLNNPSIIEDMTRQRLELLGLSVVPQHSDARVLDQLIYKWDHSRGIIAKVLADKYGDLVATGWTVTEDEIQRDVQRLFGENFWDFIRWHPA